MSKHSATVDALPQMYNVDRILVKRVNVREWRVRLLEKAWKSTQQTSRRYCPSVTQPSPVGKPCDLTALGVRTSHFPLFFRLSTSAFGLVAPEFARWLPPRRSKS